MILLEAHLKSPTKYQSTLAIIKEICTSLAKIINFIYNLCCNFIKRIQIEVARRQIEQQLIQAFHEYEAAKSNLKFYAEQVDYTKSTFVHRPRFLGNVNGVNYLSATTVYSVDENNTATPIFFVGVSDKFKVVVKKARKPGQTLNKQQQRAGLEEVVLDIPITDDFPTVEFLNDKPDEYTITPLRMQEFNLKTARDIVRRMKLHTDQHKGTTQPVTSSTQTITVQIND